MSSPEVSIVIPTLNAGPEFEGLLGMLAAQKAGFDYEVLVIDSGSTDGTVNLARRYGASVHQIPKSEFNHGGTRNMGVSLAQGEYVASIVQDAVPLDDKWLSAMVEDLEADERVAGVYSRQIPHSDCSAFTRSLVNSWATASLEPQEQYVDDLRQYKKMAPMKRRLLTAFDNVSSCLRWSVWERFPFERTNFGEDLRWGKSAVEAGYKIVYEPRSAVVHSHERGAAYDLRRHYVNQQIFQELYGARPVPGLRHLLPGIRRSFRSRYRLLEEEVGPEEARRMIPMVLTHAAATQTGTYLGVKSESLSRLSPKLENRIDRFLSKGI